MIKDINAMREEINNKRREVEIFKRDNKDDEREVIFSCARKIESYMGELLESISILKTTQELELSYTDVLDGKISNQTARLIFDISERNVYIKIKNKYYKYGSCDEIFILHADDKEKILSQDITKRDLFIDEMYDGVNPWMFLEKEQYNEPVHECMLTIMQIILDNKTAIEKKLFYKVEEYKEGVLDAYDEEMSLRNKAMELMKAFI